MVLEKTLESPLDSKEIKPVNPKGNQPWIFIGRDDPSLRFRFLADFDENMLRLAESGIFQEKAQLLCADDERKLLAFERAGFLFIFNFHHSASYSDLRRTQNRAHVPRVGNVVKYDYFIVVYVG